MPLRSGACYRCGRPGHFACQCPKNPQAGKGIKSNPRGPAPIRNDERRFFDKITMDEGGQIRNADESVRFLRAAIAFKQVEGEGGLLYRLADPKTLQVGSLRKALEYITEESVFTAGFLPLLEILGGDGLGKPVYAKPLEVVLKHLYETRFLLPALVTHMEKSIALSNDGRTALAWFLAKLALLLDEARKDESTIRLGKLLSEYGSGAECLSTILAGNGGADSKLTLACVRDQQTEIAGGRHDNDFVDFRSIKIIPTVDEFLCPADPYLPKASPEPLTVAQLLDQQFRLLREDILGPAREEQDDPRKQRRDLFEGVRVSHVATGEPRIIKKNGKETKITGPGDPCICFSFRLPYWHRASRLSCQKERENYWESSRRVLPRDGLVCFLRQNKDGKWVPIRFGTIVRREPKELAADGKSKPIVGIAFFSRSEVLESLKELSDPSVPPTKLLVVSGELFAYQPILRGLQMMDSIPFEDELLHGKAPTEQVTEPLSVPEEMRGKIENLDEGQKVALDDALSNRVALIQG